MFAFQICKCFYCIQGPSIKRHEQIVSMEQKAIGSIIQTLEQKLHIGIIIDRTQQISNVSVK